MEEQIAKLREAIKESEERMATRLDCILAGLVRAKPGSAEPSSTEATTEEVEAVHGTTAAGLAPTGTGTDVPMKPPPTGALDVNASALAALTPPTCSTDGSNQVVAINSVNKVTTVCLDLAIDLNTTTAVFPELAVVRNDKEVEQLPSHAVTEEDAAPWVITTDVFTQRVSPVTTVVYDNAKKIAAPAATMLLTAECSRSCLTNTPKLSLMAMAFPQVWRKWMRLRPTPWPSFWMDLADGNEVRLMPWPSFACSHVDMTLNHDGLLPQVTDVMKKKFVNLTSLRASSRYLPNVQLMTACILEKVVCQITMVPRDILVPTQRIMSFMDDLNLDARERQLVIVYVLPSYAFHVQDVQPRFRFSQNNVHLKLSRPSAAICVFCAKMWICKYCHLALHGKLSDKHSLTDGIGRDILWMILLLLSKPPDGLAKLILMFYFLQLTVITQEWTIAWSFSNIVLQFGNLFCTLVWSNRTGWFYHSSTTTCLKVTLGIAESECYSGALFAIREPPRGLQREQLLHLYFNRNIENTLAEVTSTMAEMYGFILVSFVKKNYTSEIIMCVDDISKAKLRFAMVVDEIVCGAESIANCPWNLVELKAWSPPVISRAVVLQYPTSTMINPSVSFRHEHLDDLTASTPFQTAATQTAPAVLGTDNKATTDMAKQQTDSEEDDNSVLHKDITSVQLAIAVCEFPSPCAWKFLPCKLPKIAAVLVCPPLLQWDEKAVWPPPVYLNVLALSLQVYVQKNKCKLLVMSGCFLFAQNNNSRGHEYFPVLGYWMLEAVFFSWRRTIDSTNFNIVHQAEGMILEVFGGLMSTVSPLPCHYSIAKVGYTTGMILQGTCCLDIIIECSAIELVSCQFSQVHASSFYNGCFVQLGVEFSSLMVWKIAWVPCSMGAVDVSSFPCAFFRRDNLHDMVRCNKAVSFTYVVVSCSMVECCCVLISVIIASLLKLTYPDRSPLYMRARVHELVIEGFLQDRVSSCLGLSSSENFQWTIAWSVNGECSETASSGVGQVAVWYVCYTSFRTTLACFLLDNMKHNNRQKLWEIAWPTTTPANCIHYIMLAGSSSSLLDGVEFSTGYGQTLFQGGRSIMVLHAFVDHHYHLDAFLNRVSGYYLDGAYFFDLAQVYFDNGYNHDSSSTKEHRVSWDPGGKGTASAWGQAEFQGGRIVSNPPGLPCSTAGLGHVRSPLGPWPAQKLAL